MNTTRISAAPNCDVFMAAQDLCTNPSTAPAALAGCPRACGLCNKPGANGQCPDTGVVNCGQLLLAGLNCSNTFMMQNCMATCRITTCLSMFTFVLFLYGTLFSTPRNIFDLFVKKY